VNLSAPFIRRPIATTLLTVALALWGLASFRLLPVSPLPQVDYPTISVSAAMPGASPETMAATVATPLERALGRIAGVTEITSTSTRGNTNVTLQFDLSRDINGAAREVQSAISASRSMLPSALTNNPSYRKLNPADSPIMLLALTSEKYTRPQIYDVATTLLAQKIAQIEGVGDVNVGGGALPAVRVNVNPAQLGAYNVSLEDVRKTIAATNVNTPKGFIEAEGKRWQVVANDQALQARDYLPLIVSYRGGTPIMISDVATVSDSVEDVHNAGIINGKPAIIIVITRQPGANIIETVDRIKAQIPALQAQMPEGMVMASAIDRSVTIRSSLREVERSLLLSVVLVTLVVWLFLRDLRATLIPAIVVPVSILGTFGFMAVAKFSVNNLTLMALTVATGFVVDDAIVVLENITRHMEAGKGRLEAALRGAKEVGFTVISISVSLVAVFIPILLMGGLVGRLFREFALTLSVAIAVSLAVSLSATPMMCSLFLRRPEHERRPSWVDRLLDHLLFGYRRSLRWVLDHGFVVTLALLATVALNVALYSNIPKGFFPQQDTGFLMGNIDADQSISFRQMEDKMLKLADIVQADPAVEAVSASIGGGRGGPINSARLYVLLKPLSERADSAEQIIARLRQRSASVTGARLVLQAAQDIRIGGRSSPATYQYTVQSDDLALLNAWVPRIQATLATLPELTDVNTDSQNRGLQTYLTYDRDKMAALGVSVDLANRTLYDAFGQESVSILFKSLNQYRVIMEVNSERTLSPESLRDVFVVTTSGKRVPLTSFASYAPANAPLSVNHQSQFVATTISFNLAPGYMLNDADVAIRQAMGEIGVPSTVQGGFQGTAKMFQESLNNQPYLILGAILAMYVILGILYESYIHPITILSTLPSAGIGALIALMTMGMEFSIIALIGVLLLIGIVKKNAIMMIDFAIDAERSRQLTPRDAIFEACQMRFRPIMMTTLAALFGALPLAIGFGEGSELRRPLGVAIVGGLLVSQALTLYTTPVVYLYFDRLRRWSARRRPGGGDAALPTPDQSPSSSTSP
jgi:multidrug efflux pump